MAAAAAEGRARAGRRCPARGEDVDVDERRTETVEAGRDLPDALQSAMAVAADLYVQLHGGRPPPQSLTPASSLDRDWGFDSLSRAELLLRVERAFRVRLPETLLARAENLDTLVEAP